MKSIHIRALGALLLSIASVPSWAQLSFPVERPQVVVGERWKYVATDGITKLPVGTREESVTAVTTSTVTVHANPSNGPAVDEVYDLSGNRLADVRGVIVRQVKIEFPLEADKTWKSSYKWVNARNRDGEMDMTYRVRGMERISVPAGTFDTVVLDGRGFWTNITTSTTGSATEVLWYAPKAKRVIRRSWITRFSMGNALDQNWVYELAEMDVKP